MAEEEIRRIEMSEKTDFTAEEIQEALNNINISRPYRDPDFHESIIEEQQYEIDNLHTILDEKEVEFERLKKENLKLIRIIRVLKAEFVTLKEENERLMEALQSLYDEQNGPPLERDREAWEKAMRMAEEELRGGTP